MSEKEQNNITVPSPREFTLPKSHILRGRQNFKRLFTASLFIKSPSVNMRFATFTSETNDVKVGFISPKKIGSAVQRNRCKRLMREAYRLNQHIINEIIQPVTGLHFVFIARKATLDFSSVQRDMVTLLNELRSHLLPNAKDF